LSFFPITRGEPFLPAIMEFSPFFKIAIAKEPLRTLNVSITEEK